MSLNGQKQYQLHNIKLMVSFYSLQFKGGLIFTLEISIYTPFVFFLLNIFRKLKSKVAVKNMDDEVIFRKAYFLFKSIRNTHVSETLILVSLSARTIILKMVDMLYIFAYFIT